MNRTYGFFSVRRQVLLISALALLTFTAFPLVWMASTAFKVSQEIFVTPPTLIPRTFTLDNVARLFDETRFLTYFRNSVTVSLSTGFGFSPPNVWYAGQFVATWNVAFAPEPSGNHQ